MTDIKERTVQDVFDDERMNDTRIEDLEEDIKMMQDELKERKIKAKALEEEGKILQIDLLKNGKIKWVECDLNEWRKYTEKNQLEDPADYHIYHYDGSIYQQGYYEGVYKLNKKEKEHFDKYFNDYFYYGYPNYQDVNHPHHNGSDCYCAFGGGGAWVETIERYQ